MCDRGRGRCWCVDVARSADGVFNVVVAALPHACAIFSCVFVGPSLYVTDIHHYPSSALLKAVSVMLLFAALSLPASSFLVCSLDPLISH